MVSSFTCSGRRAIMGVRNRPGAMVHTLIPKEERSRARGKVIAATAPMRAGLPIMGLWEFGIMGLREGEVVIIIQPHWMLYVICDMRYVVCKLVGSWARGLEG
jgi:hypothetical protein